MLTKSIIWDEIGSQLLSRTHIVNIIKVFGKKSLSQRNVLNSLYKQLMILKDVSVAQSLELMDLLIKYGTNYMTVDYYYAYIMVAHQFALNRDECGDAENIEELFQKYMEINKSNAEVGICWLMKIRRLIKIKDFNEAHSNIMHFIKFCNQYGFTAFKFEAELLHCQIYLDLDDYPSAMIISTKTLASLDHYEGTFGKTRLKAYLKLSAI